ncbi:CBS domain-containing protein [Paractinoplanes rishiriensis]|uniref:CBS domain-containing protein n=1 Tax=Paractinoplanes rishiriensis TaxID=1050105 RepID=A0A919K6V2_9ACTN|nr:CBS domain-containing protein [Actinoplanes rishiriensis]GIF01159.1 hypothetical protein Ari01nite_86230 [Actinoplanes rishiriensis]
MQCRVRDVMTADVLTVAYDATPAEIVTTMTSYDVSAVAVADEYDSVLGIVTRTDVLKAITLRSAERHPLAPWRRPAVTPDWAVTVAGRMMSAPALTVEPDATLAQAGRSMRHHQVNRLLVTGAGRRLLGIVTAADLLRVHDRTDEAIRADVRQILQGFPARDLALDVRDGEATVAATVTDTRLAAQLTRLVSAVPGVTAVRDELTVDPPPQSPPEPVRAAAHRPLDGWWPNRRPQTDKRALTATAARH